MRVPNIPADGFSTPTRVTESQLTAKDADSYYDVDPNGHFRGSTGILAALAGGHAVEGGAPIRAEYQLCTASGTRTLYRHRKFHLLLFAPGT
jgi:hypothetical protein